MLPTQWMVSCDLFLTLSRLCFHCLLYWVLASQAVVASLSHLLDGGLASSRLFSPLASSRLCRRNRSQPIMTQSQGSYCPPTVRDSRCQKLDARGAVASAGVTNKPCPPLGPLGRPDR
ncbi:hypothetical protein DER45DRAFT_234355 [Fusarium avenaceum]|nr:hypothetical protein DER45DRAFT_234355 [Fusarium avenaceum]